MYNVIFHRQALSGNEGDTEELFKLFRCSTENEVYKVIESSVREQSKLQVEYTSKYDFPAWRHPYGEIGFIILYNGYLLWQTVDFSYDGNIVDKTGFDEQLPVLSFDVEGLMQKTTKKTYDNYEVIAKFKDTEKTFSTAIKTEMKKHAQEMKERAHLKELLEKYPDMVK